MSLTKYNKKRNLSESKEPKATIKESTKGKLTFVVQEHFASHHHYDLRLEIDSVLKSWAVPKEPPQDEKTKRLAIQVEDHPYSYKDFEGTIPEGNYGAGKVKIWDKGSYDLISRNLKEIIFNLHGKKLKGKYVLLKTSYVKNGWLFFKKKE